MFPDARRAAMWGSVVWARLCVGSVGARCGRSSDPPPPIRFSHSSRLTSIADNRGDRLFESRRDIRPESIAGWRIGTAPLAQGIGHCRGARRT